MIYEKVLTVSNADTIMFNQILHHSKDIDAIDPPKPIIKSNFDNGYGIIITIGCANKQPNSAWITANLIDENDNIINSTEPQPMLFNTFDITADENEYIVHVREENTKLSK